MLDQAEGLDRQHRQYARHEVEDDPTRERQQQRSEEPEGGEPVRRPRIERASKSRSLPIFPFAAASSRKTNTPLSVAGAAFDKSRSKRQRQPGGVLRLPIAARRYR